MTNLLPFLMLLVFALLSLITPSALCADDEASLADPEGTITECEVLWREEIPRFLNMEPDATFEDSDEMRAADVAVAADGSVYLMCNIATSDRDGPKIQTLLVKYSTDGERLWHRMLDENMDDIGYSIGIDSGGNVYVVGVVRRRVARRQYMTQGFVAAYNPHGRHQWTYIEDGSNGTVRSQYQALAFHGDSVYAVGDASGRVGPGARFNDTRGDAIVTRLRLNGRKQWSRQYQGESKQWRTTGTGITVTPDGRICITGVQEVRHNARARNPGPADTDCFVCCLNANDGDEIWREIVEGDLPPALAGIQVGSIGLDIDADSLGNLYIVGRNSVDRHAAPQDERESIGTYISKLSDQGVVQWTRYCPNASTSVWANIRVRRIKVDTDGRIWVAGGVALGGHSFIGVLEYDEAGELIHALRYRSPGYDRDNCFGIAFDAGQHNLLVAGVSRQLAGRPDLFGDGDRPRPGGNRGDRRREPQQPRQEPREPKPPHYFVLRIPLLEVLTNDEAD